MSSSHSPYARLATPADAREMVRLRAMMFDSVGMDTSDPTWRQECMAYLEAHLGTPLAMGAVVDAPEGNGLAATALAVITPRIPGPAVRGGRTAYLSSVSTDERFRRRGFARGAVELLLDELASAGIPRVELHSTDAALGLYLSLGFGDRKGGREMRLVLNRQEPPSGRNFT